MVILDFFESEQTKYVEIRGIINLYTGYN